MRRPFAIGHLARYAIAFTAVLTATANAEPAISAASVTITVFADRYVVRDRAFDDLDALEKNITATSIHDVQLLICGSKSARALKAAVHRFRQLPLRIRMPDIDERDCFSTAAMATPVHHRQGQRPFGIDDAAVERYWQELIP